MPSRRRVLSGAGALAAVGGIGGAARIRHDPIEPWSPDAETWPLDRFDSANTGTNRGASVPTNPAVAWRREVLGDTPDAALVIGPDTVFASDIAYTDSTTALDRHDGAVRWRREPVGGHVAWYGGVLFVATEANRQGQDLYAFAPLDGSIKWRREHRPGGTDHIVTADGSVLIGGGGDVTMYTTDSGRRWVVDGPSRHPTGVAVGDRGVYATVRERAIRLQPRTWLAAALDRSPTVAWSTDLIDDVRVPAVTGDRLLVGSTVETGVDDARPAIAAYDAASGDRVWGALWSNDLADPPGPSVLHAGTPLVVDTVGVAALEFAGEFRSDPTRWTGDHPPVHGVTGLSLADGDVEWRRGFDTPIRDLAATSDAVLLGTGTPTGGAVVALAPKTGRERWRVKLGSGVDAVAPVNGTVFAATVAGEIVALR